jgi:hypothetical protein
MCGSHMILICVYTPECNFKLCYMYDNPKIAVLLAYSCHCHLLKSMYVCISETPFGAWGLHQCSIAAVLNNI